LKTDKLFVVLGLDSEKKPHAARFELVDEAAVRKVAGNKGFKIGRALTAEAAQLAGNLIEGRIFDSGRGLVPFVSTDIYEKLQKLLQIEDVTASSASTDGNKSNNPWANIKGDSVILCRDSEPKDRAWWECVVIGISKDSKTLTVRWKNYPALKAFTVKRDAVAILPSK